MLNFLLCYADGYTSYCGLVVEAGLVHVYLIYFARLLQWAVLYGGLIHGDLTVQHCFQELAISNRPKANANDPRSRWWLCALWSWTASPKSIIEHLTRESEFKVMMVAVQPHFWKGTPGVHEFLHLNNGFLCKC